MNRRTVLQAGAFVAPVVAIGQSVPKYAASCDFDVKVACVTRSGRGVVVEFEVSTGAQNGKLVRLSTTSPWSAADDYLFIPAGKPTRVDVRFTRASGSGWVFAVTATDTTVGCIGSVTRTVDAR